LNASPLGDFRVPLKIAPRAKSSTRALGCDLWAPRYHQYNRLEIRLRKKSQ